MSIAAVHDRIMDAAKIESAQILLPSGRLRKQNLRSGFRVRLSAGRGCPPAGDGCPLGRSGRPFKGRGYLSGPGGSLSGRRGCPSGGQY